MRLILRVIRLAGADLAHEARLSACSVLALTAIITPLLILFGLKFGLVNTMTNRLLEDPLILEVIPVGSGSHSEAWFEEVRALPEVDFVVPRTRSIATSVIVRGMDEPASETLNAELVPTAPGDPLLGDAGIAIPGEGEAVVSEETAARLGLEPGEPVQVLVRRVLNGRSQIVRPELTVAAVAPARLNDRPALWTRFGFLRDVERYRDGLAVPAFGSDGQATSETAPPHLSFRMYATDLAAVARLHERMREAGIEVRTQAHRIATVQQLSRNLSLLFWLIAGVAMTGFALALGATLWAAVERKRVTLSLIQLMGVSREGLTLFPLTQAFLLAGLAAVVSIAMFWLAAAAINGVYHADQSTGSICYILPSDLALGAALTVAVASISSLMAARSVFLVEPTEGLKGAQ